jgi:ArsR family transcriptional regulator, lead/cadmium/zinc/bismuth-responsive transcriptional repressor
MTVAAQVTEKRNMTAPETSKPDAFASPEAGRGDVYQELAETFAALADPTRVRIVSSLLDSEVCVGDLAEMIGVSESAISQHLRILRHLRLVRNRRDGKMMYYAVADDHIRSLLAICQEHVAEK